MGPWRRSKVSKEASSARFTRARRSSASDCPSYWLTVATFRRWRRIKLPCGLLMTIPGRRDVILTVGLAPLHNSRRRRASRLNFRTPALFLREFEAVASDQILLVMSEKWILLGTLAGLTCA